MRILHFCLLFVAVFIIEIIYGGCKINMLVLLSLHKVGCFPGGRHLAAVALKMTVTS